MVSLSCSSWWAEFKASSRMSVSALSFSQSSERRSDTAVSSHSPSSVVSMILEKAEWSDQSKTTNTDQHFYCWVRSCNDTVRDLHTGGGRNRGFEGRGLILSSVSPLMKHLWGVGSRGVRGDNFLNVWVGFGAFLYAECLVEGTSQLHRNRGAGKRMKS